MTMRSTEKMFSLFEKKQPDIILMEKDMPVKSGYDVVSRLKEHPVWKDIPIILIDKSYESSMLSSIVEKHVKQD
jgi:CheY-like chemotaxis protein